MLLQKQGQENGKKRGRPKKGETTPPSVTVYTVKLVIHPPSDEQLEQLREKPSTFILITNNMNKLETPDVE
ncbi:hypothetical protein GCM10011409_32790 [Lentibacillus populi]|uniref:Uncharacterized protein n=1 Tax=Lentibacillus populi TaxID=1827502 RepID=A0A9W5U0V2_9BACI|nr:hypothetical protein GCM10011409_32790 [Lentibacillus populi]